MCGAARARVGLGSHVEIELIDEQGEVESMAFDLVAEKAADIDRGLLAETTPLAKTIRGKTEGELLPYVQGDIRRVRIVAVRAGEIDATPDAAARRQAVLEEARRKAEQTNAEMFAASFSGKWGDYSVASEPIESNLADETGSDDEKPGSDPEQA